MRGAADSMGIAVTFYFETHPAPPTVVYWNFVIPAVLDSTDAVVASLQHIQAFAQNGSIVNRNLGFGVRFDGNSSTGLAFSVFGTYFGSIDTFNSTIAPALLASLPTPDWANSVVTAVDWITSLEILAGESLEQPLHGYNEHSNFYAKSVTVPEPVGFDTAVLQSYAEYVLATETDPAPVTWFAIINLYGGPDSQINDKNISSAGYSDRDALWVAQHYGFVANDAVFPDQGLTFIDGLNDAMTRNLADYGAYLGYVDSQYTAAEAHKLVSSWSTFIEVT